MTELCPRCGDEITGGCFPNDGVCQGVQVVSRKTAARQQVNACRLGLPLTEYLRLPRRERKRRMQAARKGDGGWNWQRTPDGGWYSGPPREEEGAGRG